VPLFEIGEAALVRQVERMGIFPIVVRRLIDPLDDVRRIGLDGELTARVEARTWRFLR
jgi:hypothetical protein